MIYSFTECRLSYQYSSCIYLILILSYPFFLHAPVLCKDQEKLRSAFEVILSSSVTIVSCSSNLHFRNACLSSMKVWE